MVLLLCSQLQLAAAGFHPAAQGTPHHTLHPYLPALVVGPRHDVGLALNSDYGQNYLTLHKDNSGEAESFVHAPLPLSGGRQEKFSER